MFCNALSSFRFWVEELSTDLISVWTNIVSVSSIFVSPRLPLCVCLSVCPSVCLFVCLSVCLSVCASVSIVLFLSLSIRLQLVFLTIAFQHETQSNRYDQSPSLVNVLYRSVFISFLSQSIEHRFDQCLNKLLYIYIYIYICIEYKPMPEWLREIQPR